MMTYLASDFNIKRIPSGTHDDDGLPVDRFELILGAESQGDQFQIVFMLDAEAALMLLSAARSMLLN